jgi:hypothetical protein
VTLETIKAEIIEELKLLLWADFQSQLNKLLNQYKIAEIVMAQLNDRNEQIESALYGDLKQYDKKEEKSTRDEKPDIW